MKRTDWFEKARFGMYIHFGLYSLLERGEWVMYAERIPPHEYKKLADKFNPVNADTDSWAKLARDAGMKYMCLTARHHDGFCLYDSKVSDFTSVKTAAKRDFVAEYVRSCRKFGLKVGLYYSLLDWRFPGYFLGPKKAPESNKAMIGQLHEQMRELMTNYGKIDYLNYDGEWLRTDNFKREFNSKGESPLAKYWRARELSNMVRKLQPQIVINNRSGLREDFDTPEQMITPSENGRLWESCMTIGDSCGWGYIRNMPNMKSVPQLIQYLVTCVSGGGNYILNIGPKPDGSVRKEETQRLEEIGRWLKKNGESIYGCGKIPRGFGGDWGAGMLGMSTAKGNTVYMHIFRWPGNTATIPGIKNKVVSARILATGQEVKAETTGNGLVHLTGLPVRPPDKYDAVIKLVLDGKPDAYRYEEIPL